MKRKIGTVLIIVFVLFGMALMLLLPWLITMGIWVFGGNWYFAADYRGYSEEFNLVGDYMLENFSDPVYQEGDFGFERDDDRRIVGLEYWLYDSEDVIPISLPEDIAEALTTLEKNAFKSRDFPLFSLQMRDNIVVFATDPKPHALVYSPKGRPTVKDLLPGLENRSIKTKRAGKGWYHVLYGYK